MGATLELPVRFPSLLVPGVRKAALVLRIIILLTRVQMCSPRHWKSKGLVHTQVRGCSLPRDWCGQPGICDLTWPGLLKTSGKPRVPCDFYLFSGKVTFPPLLSGSVIAFAGMSVCASSGNCLPPLLRQGSQTAAAPSASIQWKHVSFVLKGIWQMLK